MLNAHLLAKIAWGAVELDPWTYLLGVDILFLAGTATMLMALVRPLLTRSPLLSLASALAVVLATPWVTETLTTDKGSRWLLAFIAGYYDWSYFPWFPWLAYPLLGFAWCGWWQGIGLARNGLAVSRRAQAGTAIALAAVAGISWKYAVDICNNLPRYYHHDVWFFLWGCAFLAAWIVVHRLAEASFGSSLPLRWLKELGRNVTLCYAIQWLLIGNIATALYRRETLLQWGLWVMVVVTATTFLERLASSLWNRVIRQPA